MASKTVHQSQANHNEEIANELVKGNYYDWACTTAFYSALHYVEAKFYDIPEIVHTDDAYEKNKTLMKNEDINFGVHLFRETRLGGKFPSLRSSYRQLREVSEQARYLKLQDKKACDFLRRETANKLVKEDLPKIKQGLGF